MHRSRLGGIFIDCETADVDTAAAFWAAALGANVTANEGAASIYRELKTQSDSLEVLVQRVSHPSRVHIDIHTDDLEAEVQRLAGLGAIPGERVKRWCVMQAPTGQRFCVVEVKPEALVGGARTWPQKPA